MPGLFKRRRDLRLDSMFETRSEAWAAVGLEVEVSQHAVRSAAWRLILELIALIAVVAGEVALRDHITKLHDAHPPQTWLVGAGLVRVVAVVLVLLLGWLISRDVAKVAPALFRRMDPATAGTVGFLLRLLVLVATIMLALAVGGITLQAIAVGGAFTAVVLGLAAQQTLGNLFAGMVLLSARPFKLGERVRLQAGPLGGSMEGIVASLGLLYTTLSRGQERVMIPNTVVLSSAVLPLREPDPVDVKVTLAAGLRPTHVQAILDSNVSTPTRKAPSVLLQEIKGDSVIVRVKATPERASDGARLADEIIAALAHVTGEHRSAANQQSDGVQRGSGDGVQRGSGDGVRSRRDADTGARAPRA
jgi:small conductance mechanosensitive channel